MPAVLRSLVLIGLCLQLSSTAAAQWQQPRLTLLASPAYTLANSAKYYYTAGWSYAMGGRLLWQTEGDAYWVRYWGQPSLGVEFSYCSNPSGVAGDRFGAVALLRHPLWPQSPFTFQLGCGLSCYTEPYSRTHDDLNRHIGSYLNCLIDLGVEGHIPMADNERLLLGVHFLHTSNGYLKKPNNGLNYLQCEAGIELPITLRHNPYLPKPTSASTPWGGAADKDSAYRYRDMLFLSYAPGLVQSRHSMGSKPYYYTYTAQLGVMHAIHPCFAYGLNVDFMFNYSHKEQFAWYHDGYQMKKVPYYVGLVANWENYWGPISLRLSLGGTLLKSVLVTIPYYERVGVYYHFGDRRPQHVGVALKAYGAHIDYIEWTYGLSFRLQ